MPNQDSLTLDDDLQPNVHERPSILSPQYRLTTIGIVSLVALMAFEALAIATAMPAVARALDGLALYAIAFGITLATSVVGMTVAGGWYRGWAPGACPLPSMCWWGGVIRRSCGGGFLRRSPRPGWCRRWWGLP